MSSMRSQWPECGARVLMSGWECVPGRVFAAVRGDGYNGQCEYMADADALGEERRAPPTASR